MVEHRMLDTLKGNVYKPELASDLRQANYHGQSEIEIVDEPVYDQLGHIKHAVFDYDGTISIVRQGWESIMEQVMVGAILGDQYETAGMDVIEKVRMQVLEFIDLSTGIQTIVQMEALVEMVSRFGMVPKEKILDKFGYKEIFNESLVKMAHARISKFESGHLNLDDLTVKGAVSFLEKLREKGVKLYLASGTDRSDILNETNSFGIAHLFNGGIYGSVGDISKYSKRMVVDNIVKDNQLAGNELAVFGDGPVEIQVCRRLNGIAIGVASNEIRRYGLNTEKRVRLVKSGAKIIIPDFSCSSRLLELLFAKP